MENNRYREEEKELEKETISEKDVDSKEQVLVEELEKELEETEAVSYTHLTLPTN